MTLLNSFRTITKGHIYSAAKGFYSLLNMHFFSIFHEQTIFFSQVAEQSFYFAFCVKQSFFHKKHGTQRNQHIPNIFNCFPATKCKDYDGNVYSIGQTWITKFGQMKCTFSGVIVEKGMYQ